jgi:hypothetical protein
MSQQCRVCGCTNFSACAGGCWWVEDDLCSTCGSGPTGDALDALYASRRVADMDPLEALYARAIHDLDCGEQGLAVGIPVDHELEAHEPWSGADRDGDIQWSIVVDALRGRGLAIVELAP